MTRRGVTDTGMLCRLVLGYTAAAPATTAIRPPAMINSCVRVLAH